MSQAGCPACPHARCSLQVRLQTQTTYRGIVDCMVKTYRHESVGGLLLGALGREASGQSVPTSFSPSSALSLKEREKTQIWDHWGPERWPGAPKEALSRPQP